MSFGLAAESEKSAHECIQITVVKVIAAHTEYLRNRFLRKGYKSVTEINIIVTDL